MEAVTPGRAHSLLIYNTDHQGQFYDPNHNAKVRCCITQLCQSKLGGIGTEDDPSKASDAPLLGSLGGEGEETDIL